MKSKATVNKVIRIPEDVVKIIDTLRAVDNRSFNNYVVNILTKHVKPQQR